MRNIDNRPRSVFRVRAREEPKNITLPPHTGILVLPVLLFVGCVCALMARAVIIVCSENDEEVVGGVPG